MSEHILEVRAVSKEFPGVRALDAVDFAVRRGEVHALLGENGAGKSTLIKILAGVYQKDTGEIVFDGRPVDINSAADSLRLGIKVVFQELSLIPELSVAENVFLESFPLKRNRTIDWRKLNADTAGILRSVGLDVPPQTPVRKLTVSQQQMVEIARALSHEAKLIVMDEPTSALTPNEVRALFEVIRSLKERGIGIIYVTHKLEEVYEVCDRYTVLRDGKLVATREVAGSERERIIHDMVGRTVTDLFPRTHAVGDREVLRVGGLATKAKLRGVSFSVRAGEVVGFFGLMGAGRTELARAVFGLDPLSVGRVTLEGGRQGLGLLTEDRKGEGLVLQMSVTRNITLPTIRRFATLGMINRLREDAGAREYVERLAIKTPSLGQKVMFLSGGNQQKVLLSRWLMKRVNVILLDEPTRGIDVAAKAEIYRLIDELAGSGVGVVLLTSEMPELLGLSDRIIVLHEGRVTGEFGHDDATQEAVLAAAIA